MSYTETADRLRVKSRRGRFEQGAQLVANWVEVLGAVVAEPHLETVWPESVVLDATWFMMMNPTTGTSTQAFAVLGVFGYEPGAKTGLLLVRGSRLVVRLIRPPDVDLGLRE